MSGFFVKNNGKEYEAEIINSRIIYTIKYKESGIIEDNVEEYRVVDLFPPIQDNSVDSSDSSENNIKNKDNNVN